MTVKSPSQPTAYSHHLLVMGLFVAGIGSSFIPWVWRDAVALQLTAPGLAEFVKFLPEIRTLQLQVERLHFLEPLFCAIIALPLIATNYALRLPTWWRWFLRASVIPLALASLSPVWTPTTLTNDEFRQQTILALVAMTLAIIAPLFQRLPLWLLVITLTIAGSRALILAGLQFSHIQAALTEVYLSPVNLGLGWWLTLGGFMVSVGSGLWACWPELRGLKERITMRLNQRKKG